MKTKCPWPFLLIFLISCADSAALADVDYSARFNLRTYPVGTNIDGTIGYSYAVWGDSSKFLYGYTRVSATYGTAVVNNSGKVEAEVFPISFLGFNLSRTWSYLSVLPPGFDCTTLTCTGAFNNSRMGAKAYFGVPKGPGGFVSYDRIFFDSRDPSQNIASPTYGLVLAPVGEVASAFTGFLGYPLIDRWMIGSYFQYTQLDLSSGTQNGEYLVLNKSFDPWSVAFSAGRFQSSSFGVGTSFVFSLSWVGLKRMGLGI